MWTSGRFAVLGGGGEVWGFKSCWGDPPAGIGPCGERMTWRAAARALGLAASAFLDLAREHGVPVVRVSSAGIAQDLDTLDKLTVGRSGPG